jgi:hypothetical protein
MSGKSGIVKLFVAALVCSAAIGCSEDEQSLGNECPNLPLYHYAYDSASAKWQLVLADGGALSAADLAALKTAQEGTAKQAGRCLTPQGAAQTLGASDAGN